MKAKIRSYLLPCLLAVVLALALVPALMPSAQAADAKTPVATTYNKIYYLDENNKPTWGYRPFYTINEAWEAARKGEPIKLTQDWDTYTYLTLVVPSGESVTVHLDGHTIDRHYERRDDYGGNEPGAVFWVKSGANLTVYGADKKGSSGTLKGGHTSVGYYGDGRGGVRVDKDAKLIMDKVNVEDCIASNNGGAIWAIDGASVTLTNMDFSGCLTRNGTGGAIYVEKVALSMENCTITNCYSNEKDGAIALWDCTDVTLSLNT